MSDYDTKPTIETLLEEVKKGFAAVALELAAVRDDISDLQATLTRIEYRQNLQDDKIDTFIKEVLELKRQMRHPV